MHELHYKDLIVAGIIHGSIWEYTVRNSLTKFSCKIQVPGYPFPVNLNFYIIQRKVRRCADFL